jgi:hypothetical protein
VVVVVYGWVADMCPSVVTQGSLSALAGLRSCREIAFARTE